MSADRIKHMTSKLVADNNSSTNAVKPTSIAGANTYSCPMHPEVVSDKPSTCPKCGMTLKSSKAPKADHSKHSTPTEHSNMMLDDHRKMLWPHYVNLILGIWLLIHPFSIGYLSNFVPDANVLRVMAERGLPSFEMRNLAM